MSGRIDFFEIDVSHFNVYVDQLHRARSSTSIPSNPLISFLSTGTLIGRAHVSFTVWMV